MKKKNQKNQFEFFFFIKQKKNPQKISMPVFLSQLRKYVRKKKREK